MNAEPTSNHPILPHPVHPEHHPHGQFAKDDLEYIIQDPFTPRPWHNYLVNEIYAVNVTQWGLGASFYQPTGEGLRTNVTEDRDGQGGARLVYLRDRDSGLFGSITGAHNYQPPPEWSCRIGLGYQINGSVWQGIRCQWRVFVPPTGDPAEFWSVTLRNESERARQISVFPYLELHLTGGSTLMDFIAVLGGRYVAEQRAVYGINSCVKFPPRFKAFLAADRTPDAVTISRDKFIGPYRTLAHPLAVESGAIDNREAGTEWLGASHRHDLSLAAGASVTLHFLIGVVESIEEGGALIARLLAPGQPDACFQMLTEKNQSRLQVMQARTPDAQFNRWTNVWLKHQLDFVGHWGRVIGRGFRDILQDSFGHRLIDPALARRCLLEVFAKQFPDGSCIRAWRLPNGLLDMQNYADSPSWMIMALSYYLKETGDFSVLDESVPFLNAQDPYQPATSSASVWDHVVLAQRYLLAHRGRHGLSKIYYGDWCDTMNGVGARGEGESVMLSFQVKWGCDLLAELAVRLGQNALAEEMQQASRELHQALQTHAWDGEWFVRAFDDDGLPVGSNTPPPQDEGEGRIFLNAQSWAVISGVATPEQTQSALDAAQRYLNVGYGMVLNWPAFTRLRPRIGQMTAMTPGFYENGSVYVHGNCFWIQALITAGRADEAWQAIRAILPDTPNKPNGDTEPFVIPNFYIGPNVTRRRQRNLYLSGWRTGSAAWIYMSAVEGILGARAEYDGLRLTPQPPSGWGSYQFTRRFRGAHYTILVESEPQGGRTVNEVWLDGRRIEGTLLPLPQPGAHHRVTVRLH